MYKEDTIAAVATPIGEGGVGIVRVSGPESERIAKEIFTRSGGRNGVLRSHTLHHGVIRDPHSGDILDEVLVTLMRKPRSYTGEDVFEVHCHGGPFLVRDVLRLVLSLGARPAEPGEFTKRSFLNGRVDLSQAEAVLELVRARTDKARRLALGQSRGGLSRWVRELREELLDIVVQLEAAIDFPEEEIELLRREEMSEKLSALAERVSGLVSSYEWGRLFREGVRVCIAGSPNVGKSSLLNALLGEERVIVSAVPGTTRDFIEESINLGGLEVALWDTAGIREGTDDIEKLGVDLARRRLGDASSVLVVLDGSRPLGYEDRLVLAEGRDKKGLLAINKVDLPKKIEVSEVSALAGDKPVVFVSALEGRGIEDLKAAMYSLLLGVEREPEIIITNFRHKAALEKAGRSLREALRGLRECQPPELVAVDIQAGQEALEEIIGIVTSEDVLERIFGQFCIGK